MHRPRLEDGPVRPVLSSQSQVSSCVFQFQRSAERTALSVCSHRRLCGFSYQNPPYEELQIFDARDNDTQITDGKNTEESSVVFYPIPAASLANVRGTRERPRWKD